MKKEDLGERELNWMIKVVGGEQQRKEWERLKE